MKIVCISCSNIKASTVNSTSVKLSKLIQCACMEMNPSYQFTPYDLRQFEFTPCDGCGACYQMSYQCCQDKDYNQIAEQLIRTDVLFIVSPHYAPIPAKLTMLLEKLEQNTFLKRFNDESHRSPLFGKPVGIIGHGGGTKEVSAWYRGVIMESIANALSYPIEMKLVDQDETSKHGVIIPVEKVSKQKESIFPIQEYDWESIKRIVVEYVEKVVKSSCLHDSY